MADLKLRETPRVEEHISAEEVEKFVDRLHSREFFFGMVRDPSFTTQLREAASPTEKFLLVKEEILSRAHNAGIPHIEGLLADPQVDQELRDWAEHVLRELARTVSEGHPVNSPPPSPRDSLAAFLKENDIR